MSETENKTIVLEYSHTRLIHFAITEYNIDALIISLESR